MEPEITFTLKPGHALVIDGGTVRIIDLNEAVTKGAPCACAAPEPQREATPTTEQQSEPEFEAAQREADRQAVPVNADILQAIASDPRWRSRSLRAIQKILSQFYPDDVRYQVGAMRARGLLDVEVDVDGVAYYKRA